tara:strand:+ start:737 stop:949 length:213 start_codon:yes stop_codon:yes gene_type:complete
VKNWLGKKTQDIKDWVLEKSPPPFRAFAKKNPRTFWTIIFILWAVPFGLTVYAGLSVVVWALTWMASVRL